MLSEVNEQTTPEVGCPHTNNGKQAENVIGWRGTYTAQKAGRSAVKISKDTGRRENLIGLVLCILFIVLY